MGFLDRFFYPVAALLLLMMGVVEVESARQESATYDEGLYLAAGVSYWKTGDYRMNPEHPPLAKLLSAIPVLFMNVRLPGQAWEAGDEDAFGYNFLFANDLPGDTILFPARMVTVALSLLLGLAIAFWTRSHFGSETALLALAFFAFDPNIIAHSRYVTNDLIAALFSFLACVLWGEALTRKSIRWSALAGLALGLAMASKSTALFLIPAFVVLGLIRRPDWKMIVAAPLTAYLVFMATYLPELINYPSLIPHAYMEGIKFQLHHNSVGHQSYLLGQISDAGWWYYFPVAFLVKAPLALLALTVLAVALLILKRPKLPFEALVLGLPAVIYGVFCLYSRLNLGIRYLLPGYVLLIPLLAFVVVRYTPKMLPIGLALLLMVESLSIYPDYLAFFNWPSGGPSNGPHYLLDSNIDWGQDSRKLKLWLDARHIPDICLIYFGNAPPTLYGIQARRLPGNDETSLIQDIDCVAVASVTPLYGLYVANDPYRWLRVKKPDAMIGYSMYVYDLRRKK